MIFYSMKRLIGEVEIQVKGADMLQALITANQEVRNRGRISPEGLERVCDYCAGGGCRRHSALALEGRPRCTIAQMDQGRHRHRNE